MSVLRGKLLLIILATLIVGSSIPSSFAQQGTVTYNVHIDFFYACSLSNLRVTLNDRTGRVVAATQIPDAFELTLTYMTTTPTNSLTVTAFAQASTGSYYSGAVSGSRTITVGDGGDYWTMVQLR